MISKNNCGKPCCNMDKKLLKKARKKYLSAEVARELVELKSPLKKQYLQTFSCCHSLEVDEVGEMRSNFYCRRRWCHTCASITMATLIDKYCPTFAKMGPNVVHFVTLTVRNCSGVKIPDTLNTMLSTWRRIADKARKEGRIFRGVRKIEVKASKQWGYHPHFHALIEGKEAAEWLVAEWLQRLPKYTTKKAQHIREVEDENDLTAALVEVFKYATKTTCAEDTDNRMCCTPQELDTIFRAVKGRRLVQPFGGIRGVTDEEAFDITPQIVEAARGIWIWNTSDWWHVQTGEALTGYQPETNAETIDATSL